MSSLTISRSKCKSICDTYAVSNTRNLPFTTGVLTMNDTPSPSSTTSSNIIERSIKRSKNHMFSKLRHRHDKLMQCTDSLTRHYVITTTNIIFQMQKQINKLKRRTLSLEQKLARQTQLGHPIIRIPRLTKDELSLICVKNTPISSNNELTVVTTVENPLNVQPIENPTLAVPFPQGKFCVLCQHEFSHRSGFLRHLRRKHKMNLVASNSNIHNETHTTVLPIEQSEKDSGSENDTTQLLVTPWDIGEGRLRPRRISKSYNESFAKIKCTFCNKFFREEYIEKHVRRVHQTPKASIPADDLISPTFESPIPQETYSDELPSSATIADIDISDTATEFQNGSTQSIIFSTTCLDNYQQEIVDEFLQKFSSRVRQTSNIDSHTTHLIVNDAKSLLYSTVSLKLIEGIAHHCYCVSYRWLIDCLKYDRIIDECLYEIEGDDSGTRAYGGPKRSRLSDKQRPLFDGFCFMIKCTEKNDIHMLNDRLQQLIITCGGIIITCVTQDYLDRYKVIVLCDRLYVSERRHNYDQCRSLKIEFLSSNWVLESILEYRLKPMEPYFEKPL